MVRTEWEQDRDKTPIPYLVRTKSPKDHKIFTFFVPIFLIYKIVRFLVFRLSDIHIDVNLCCSFQLNTDLHLRSIQPVGLWLRSGGYGGTVRIIRDRPRRGEWGPTFRYGGPPKDETLGRDGDPSLGCTVPTGSNGTVRRVCRCFLIRGSGED